MRKLLILAALVFTVACGGSPQQQQWGQGYETPQGYQEPDHGYFYYWMLYHSTFGYYQPHVVYHVYVPPVGYPREYRPWQSREYVRSSDGRFVRTTTTTTTVIQKPVAPPVKPAAGSTPARSVGGFAAQKPVVKDNRATGGFAPKPAAAPSQTRSTGGFSKPAASSSSSSRSTGGFSSRKK